MEQMIQTHPERANEIRQRYDRRREQILERRQHKMEQAKKKT